MPGPLARGKSGLDEVSLRRNSASPRTHLFAAAVLIFLAAAAGARVIAADFGPDADRFGFGERLGRLADDVALAGPRRGGALAKGAGLLVHRPLRHFSQELLESDHARGAAEDVVANLGLDVDHEVLEQLERFRLVFDQRITLAVGAEADAVPQGVHVVEMFLP